jgi:hypothetical protein
MLALVYYSVFDRNTQYLFNFRFVSVSGLIFLRVREHLWRRKGWKGEETFEVFDLTALVLIEGVSAANRSSKVTGQTSGSL